MKRRKRSRLIYLSSALDDLQEIYEYIHEDNPDAAEAQVSRIERSLEKLTKYPELGKLTDDDELRMLGFRTFVIDNYIFFYIHFEDIVEIHKIIHSRRYSFLVE